MNKGDLVHYMDSHSKKTENGIVKFVPADTSDYLFVVYNCGGNWDDYENYTGVRTDRKDLSEGWV